MKKLLFVSFLIIAIILSCEKDNKAENLIDDLPWLKEIKNSLKSCTCDVSIFKGTYNNQTVYFTLMNDPVCNSVFGTSLWNEKGETIKTYGPSDQNLFASEVTNKIVLYTCSD